MLYKTKTPLGKDGKALKKSGQAIVGYLQSIQFAYNANHELTESVTITQEGLSLKEVTTKYQYDAFGRRISKQIQTKDKTRRVHKKPIKIIKFPVQQQKTEYKQVNYLWDGNRQLQEQTDTHVFTTIYEQDSFEPVARLVWLQDELLKSANDEIKKAERESWEPEPELIPNIQVYHYHNDHLGTPNELNNQDGEVVWLADYEAWGNTAKVVWREEQLGQLKVSAEELQPLRFQGQFIDQETGLHYNRFRYYDPDLGMFTTRDPIGLMGGNNVFQYAPNPVGWVDPWGLSKKDPCGSTNRDSGTFPKTADEMSSIIGPPSKVGLTPDGTVRTTWTPNSNTRIRHESHPHGIDSSSPNYNPRHHGEHFHVETKPDGMSWSKANRTGQVLKSKPEGYTPGSGTGFLPGEKFPGY